MSFEALHTSEPALHPVNFWTYTANTIPERDVEPEVAQAWAKYLSETHVPLYDMPTSELLTVEEIIWKGTEFDPDLRERAWNGDLIAGPLFNGDVVSVKGISLWAPSPQNNPES